MGLSWDLTGIEGYRARCYTKVEDGYQLNVLTERLIWATIHVDIGKITEENCEEFCTRLRMTRRILGGIPKTTLNEIKSHIGLKTNVPTVARAKWIKSVASAAWEEEERVLYNEKNEEEE